MLTLRKSAMAALLLATFGTSGMARAMVIDLFDEAGSPTVKATDQRPADTNAVIAFEGNSAWTTVIGGSRDLYAYLTASVGTGQRYVETSISAGEFVGYRRPSTQGVNKVHWDGAADGVLSTSGLGSLDLTWDGATKFVFDVLSDSTGGAIDLTLWDSDSSFTGSFTSAALTTSSIYFLDFSTFMSNGVDMTDIGAIQLSLAGAASRVVGINSLTTNGVTPTIPEPATLALLGLGLLGLGFSRRARIV